jgi:E3 ubiquitin-protein ligase UBR1
MCSRCFNATDHVGHNITLYLSQQPGGCCDCGDAEAWRKPIGCPFHPLADTNALPAKATARTLENWTPKVHNPHRVNIPGELRESMAKTVAYALDFIIDTLDYSPDEAVTPKTEEDLRAQPTSDPTSNDVFAIVVWNDEKHSFEDVAQIVSDTTGVTYNQALKIADTIDDQVRFLSR